MVLLTAALALMFTTEAQYDTEEKVQSIIRSSGLPASQNIIGIDPNWHEARAARKEIAAAGAKLHVYHQGPGMREFGESPKDWEKKLRKMLLEHREAVSYEVDNIDQLDVISWIVKQQAWQREVGFTGKLVLKNVEPTLMRRIKESDRIDQSLISPFFIIEADSFGERMTRKMADAGRQYGMTPVFTTDTNHYRTSRPVIHQ